MTNTAGLFQKIEKFVREQNTGAILVVCMVLILGYSAFNYTAISAMKEDAKWVGHTHEVISSGHQIEKLMVDLETGERGFLITGNETFLEPFWAAQDELSDLIKETRMLVSDNPDQVQLIDQVAETLNTWFSVAGNAEIDLRRKVNNQSIDNEYLQTVLARGVGKGILDEIRAEAGELDDFFVSSQNETARRLLLSITKAVVDQETGQRGFLITGKEEFLEPYTQGQVDFHARIDELQSLLDRAFDPDELLPDLIAAETLLKRWQQLSNTNRVTPSTKASESATQKILADLTPPLTRLSIAFSDARNFNAASQVLAIKNHLETARDSDAQYQKTRDPRLLTAQDNHVADAAFALSKAKQMAAMTSDINVAYRHLNRIESLAQRWKTVAAMPEIDIRRKMLKGKASMSDVIEMVSRETGKILMDIMRDQLQTFVGVEQTLLAKRKAQDASDFNRTILVQIIGSIIYSGLLVLMFVLSSRLRKNSIVLAGEQSKMEGQSWVKSSFSQISSDLQSCNTIEEASNKLITELVPMLGSHMGLVYRPSATNDDDGSLRLKETYAYHRREKNDTLIQPGEGLVGQAALEKKTILLTRHDDSLPMISTGSADVTPGNIVVFPVLYEDRLLMVVEVASTGDLTELHMDLIEAVSEGLGLVFNNILFNIETARLLQESQTQAEELESQKDNLSSVNSRLEQQKMQMQASEEELRVANDGLTEKQNALTEQQVAIEAARRDAENKATELAQANKYKSEFLANMSHELRTPLNSLLILSKMLADNADGNLTEKQVTFSNTIHDSGNDLLILINEILDLSKIESGKVSVEISSIHLDDVVRGIRAKFEPSAESRGIDLVFQTDHAPQVWHSDGQKLDQILKNLLSNAIKFTEEGSVSLTIGTPAPEAMSVVPHLRVDETLAFTVTDTGIGIAKDKQSVIFEAFQQADGTTSRKFGGTGLGLSISRELSSLLGGAIHIESEEGKGSSFTLLIPRKLETKDLQMSKAEESEETLQDWSNETLYAQNPDQVLDVAVIQQDIAVNAPLGSTVSVAATPYQGADLEPLAPGARSILLIEDDERFSNIVADVARGRDFEVLVAPDGKTGLQLADHHQPSGIILDIGLPDIDGRQVFEVLKNNPKTRHIPVHFMSAHDSPGDIIRDGALGFVTKPASMQDLQAAFERIENVIDRPVKRLLLIEDDPQQRMSILELIGAGDVETVVASSGSEAQSLLVNESFDCIVLDLGLPDMDGVDLLETVRTNGDLKNIPVIIYTGRDLSDSERATLDRYAQSIIVKDVRSPEHLLDDTTLFLHRIEANLPEGQQKILRSLHDSEAVLRDRKVLIVDDDMRNVFSLSTLLQDKEMNVLTAGNGLEALAQLDADPEIDIVLMDIMMPEMDGYEAMTKIREQERFGALPIIALTAKAMSTDRSKCIEAGANDYMAKPVNTDKLFSVMRVWLHT